MSTATARRPTIPEGAHRIRLRGAAAWLMRDAAGIPEVVIHGPYGTGKTRGGLEHVHRLLLQNKGARWLLMRKTLTSLTNSALVTFREQVLQPGEARFFGGNKERSAAYEYRNGSVLVLGGMDKASKVLSTEYDGAYVVECNELTEGEWETIGGRLRHGRLPFQQLIGDCNPQGPQHWIKRREARGQLVLRGSTHRDNPGFHDGRDWTERGAAYMARLDGTLTGIRRARNLEGRWVAAEGVIYEGWNPEIHHIYRYQVPPLWPRYWSIDFGYVHPFVWGEWTIDPDGRLILVREIYRTGRIVADHCRTIKSLAPRRPVAIVTDHDAEDRATFEREMQMPTIPAYKAVSPGIQAVAARLRVAGDGRPRLMLMRDAVVEPDPVLIEGNRPHETAAEFDGYVWDTTSAGARQGERLYKEHPVKINDDGMDMVRYMVAHIDQIGREQGQAGVITYRR